jgi:glutathione S-transferase
MLTVHHLNQSRSQRVIWALEELSLPYQIVHYQREKNMLAPAALKKCIRWANRRSLKITG